MQKQKEKPLEAERMIAREMLGMGKFRYITHVYFSTPCRKIGKHDCRLVVRESERGYGRVTDFEFRDAVGNWCPQPEWPTFDSNDGCHAGCPKGLRKIWEDHRDEVEAALDDRPVVKQQLELV
jgi:hypothetical protein